MQQGGRRWQRSLFPWFKALGFRQCEADNCVFSILTAGDALYVGCYVDDLFILYLQDGADSLYASFTHKLTQCAAQAARVVLDLGFPLFEQGRLLFARVDIGVTKFSTKSAEKEFFWGGLRFCFISGRAHPVFSGEFSLFFGRGKTNFYWEGYNFKAG